VALFGESAPALAEESELGLPLELALVQQAGELGRELALVLDPEQAEALAQVLALVLVLAAGWELVQVMVLVLD